MTWLAAKNSTQKQMWPINRSADEKRELRYTVPATRQGTFSLAGDRERKDQVSGTDQPIDLDLMVEQAGAGRERSLGR